MCQSFPLLPQHAPHFSLPQQGNSTMFACTMPQQQADRSSLPQAMSSTSSTPLLTVCNTVPVSCPCCLHAPRLPRTPAPAGSQAPPSQLTWTAPSLVTMASTPAAWALTQPSSSGEHLGASHRSSSSSSRSGVCQANSSSSSGSPAVQLAAGMLGVSWWQIGRSRRSGSPWSVLTSRCRH